MVLSYSSAAKPSSDTPKVISIASATHSAPQPKDEETRPEPSSQPLPTPSSEAGPSRAPVASTSTPTPAAGSVASTSSSSKAPVQHLILDAGPLLSLTPLRHLATNFHTTPQVLAELRDPKAREHWQRLLLSGMDIKVETPSADAMARVTAFAKKTGDYAVLSQTDLGVIALTCQYELAVNGEENIRTEPGQRKGKAKAEEPAESDKVPAAIQREAEPEQTEDKVEKAGEQLEVEDEEASEDEDEEVPEVTQALGASQLSDHPSANTEAPQPEVEATQGVAAVAAPDDEEESDGGEWITPSNITQHRSHDLGLVPDDSRNATVTPLAAACFTGDYAVQNVLLGMGLGLTGEGGKRISKVKSFVLRCHACFKLCRDSTKRFCPSCGNASLIRTTVTTSSSTGKQTIHLKKNFQYHTRGTKYSIPDPQMGRAKGQIKGGSGLILREDQAEWMDAVKSQDIRRAKEERRVAKGSTGSWNDPDWLPEIITVGMSGKGRSGGHNMPAIGHGRKNPNQTRRTKR